ncbi:MAG: hypothetical protein HC904_01900 [Blastochloris sp.]|nr:hypothetical protein [Blastochloris sp.]
MIVVGGQAVNFWANKYHRTEKELLQFRPYTSEDVDFYGLKKEAISVAQALGVEIQVPRKSAASPVSASFEVTGPGGTKMPVHFLHNLCGLKNELVADSAIEGVWKNKRIRVTNPIVALKGKIACLHQLSQKDRQDEKHVRMLIPCVRGFLKELCGIVDSGRSQEARRLLQTIEKLTDMLAAPDGKAVAKKYRIDFSGVLPVEELKKIKNSKLEKFLSTRYPQILKQISF